MYYICDEGHGGLPDAFYQLKNIVPSLSYRDFKFGFHIQLHCSRALETRFNYISKSKILLHFSSNLVIMFYGLIRKDCEDRILIITSEAEILTIRCFRTVTESKKNT